VRSSPLDLHDVNVPISGNAMQQCKAKSPAFKRLPAGDQAGCARG